MDSVYNGYHLQRIPLTSGATPNSAWGWVETNMNGYHASSDSLLPKNVISKLSIHGLVSFDPKGVMYYSQWATPLEAMTATYPKPQRGGVRFFFVFSCFRGSEFLRGDTPLKPPESAKIQVPRVKGNKSQELRSPGKHQPEADEVVRVVRPVPVPVCRSAVPGVGDPVAAASHAVRATLLTSWVNYWT